MCRKVSFESSSQSQHSKENTVVRGNIGGIIDCIGENAGSLRLTLLVNPQEQVAEHRRRIIHKRRRKDDGDRGGIEFGKP